MRRCERRSNSVRELGIEGMDLDTLYAFLETGMYEVGAIPCGRSLTADS